MSTTDFSLRHFGVPDATIAAFWKHLEKQPRIPPHSDHMASRGLCRCFTCENARRRRVHEHLMRHPEDYRHLA